MKATLATIAVLLLGATLYAQGSHSHADSLRGSVTPERVWWDALHYGIHVQFNSIDSTIAGHNRIQYKILGVSRRLQIDLQVPLILDSAVQDGHALSFERDGNVYFITPVSTQPLNEVRSVDLFYHGKPRIAARPPWDGGLIWAKDKKGRPWISVACQGLGASVWYPCKDHQGDEPDSASLHITVPDSLVAVANGRLQGKTVQPGRTVTYHWKVTSPINTYNLIPYVGHYVNFKETYRGERGPLDVTYWVLDYNLPAAQTHLRRDVRRTLKDLEFWFGPYPFYADGYQIVDAPHLGMEHQSAIAYGNGYQNGYLGHDLSGSGWGLKWDFIVVHESAHEWFGNNISTKDIADSWVHESFANYSETLFTTSEYGKEAGNDYVIGTRSHIRNDAPIIGDYNVNGEGSSDMYYKGGNLLHLIRQIINDDEKFRQILRGLNKDFYHQTVTTADIESNISRKAGIDFSKVFDQYLRTTHIPVFSYSIQTENGKTVLRFVWTNCVDGFDMPVKVSLTSGKSTWLKPSTTSQSIPFASGTLPEKIVDRNFYVEEKKDSMENR